MNDSQTPRETRLKHRASIRVIPQSASAPFVALMRDFSNSGLFIHCSPEQIPELETLVEIQTTEIEDAPIRTTQVVRIEAGIGFGVKFI